MAENIFFRPEELNYFDAINAEVPSLVSPRAKYFLKILQPVTTEGRFEKDVLYGEDKRQWKFVGPLVLPVYMELPSEPKEFDENRGGNLDIKTTCTISRKLFEEAIPHEIANILIAVRGALIPNAGDVMLIWTTHQGDVAGWDVESVERDAYLGDLPLHLHWKLTIERRSRYASERAFGQDLEPKEPIVILDSDQFEFLQRSNTSEVLPPRPKTLVDGQLNPSDIEKRALGR